MAFVSVVQRAFLIKQYTHFFIIY